MTADQQMGHSAQWVFQVGGERVNTAGYTEQRLGAASGKHQPFSLRNKLTAPSINTASIVYLRPADPKYHHRLSSVDVHLDYCFFQPSEGFNHHIL